VVGWCNGNIWRGTIHDFISPAFFFCVAFFVWIIRYNKTLIFPLNDLFALVLNPHNNRKALSNSTKTLSMHWKLQLHSHRTAKLTRFITKLTELRGNKLFFPSNYFYDLFMSNQLTNNPKPPPDRNSTQWLDEHSSISNGGSKSKTNPARGLQKFVSWYQLAAFNLLSLNFSVFPISTLSALTHMIPWLN
jgi:hypothetical protein